MEESKKPNSKIRWGRIVIAVLILAVVIVSAVYFTGVHREKEEAKETVNQFLTAYQQMDPKCGEYLRLDTKETDISFKGVQKTLAENMTFSLGGVSREEDVYLVDAVITTPDFAKAFEYVEKNAPADSSEEQILEMLYDQLRSKDAEKRDFEMQIPVYSIRDTRKVILSADLSNGLSGGYNEYLEKMIGGQFGDEKNN